MRLRERLAGSRTPWGAVRRGQRRRRPDRLPITDDLLRQLSDIETDGNIVPPPTLTVEKRTLRGAEIAVVTVAPSDSPPVKYKGRIWIRVGPRRAIASDPRCLATLKPFRGLMPLAQESRKPMFSLRAADGAIGGHAAAVQQCYDDFRTLARELAKRCGLALP